MHTYAANCHLMTQVFDIGTLFPHIFYDRGELAPDIRDPMPKVTIDRVPFNDKSTMTSSNTRMSDGGKGDNWRPHNQKKYAENYERIFHKKKESR